MKLIKRSVYVSEDGRYEFKSAKECIDYEKTVALRAILHNYAPHGISSDTEIANFIIERWDEINLVMDIDEEKGTK